jgi:hypothetical protein
MRYPFSEVEVYTINYRWLRPEPPVLTKLFDIIYNYLALNP